MILKTNLVNNIFFFSLCKKIYFYVKKQKNFFQVDNKKFTL
jgi:hypothetical protein